MAISPALAILLAGVGAGLTIFVLAVAGLRAGPAMQLRAVKILFGHAKIDSIVRCLGVDVEDALELAYCCFTLATQRGRTAPKGT